MTLELITQIKKTEEDAGNLVSESIASSRKILADAQDKKEMLLKLAHEDAIKKADEFFKKAKEDIRVKTEAILDQAKKDSSILKEKAQANVDETIQKVIERIVDNGSS